MLFNLKFSLGYVNSTIFNKCYFGEFSFKSTVLQPNLFGQLLYAKLQYAQWERNLHTAF